MTGTAVAKQPSTKAMAVKSFQDVMNNNYYQSLLQNTLRENKGTFCTSLMELFSSDEKLMQCKPTDLMAEALKQLLSISPSTSSWGSVTFFLSRTKV